MWRTLFEIVVGISLMMDDKDEEEQVKKEETKYPVELIDEESEY